ncbi:cellulase family glycosylhydrolase [Mycolicibacterium phocaicum]|uniref:cellulase family glycosylhydrolase n=1 Tax=Mycolicibacterium phocaicum TaxID=319706 RepID=UPI001CF9B263|nr:cellulase family glycosylhydrolase [Mycolicibacterium phocaicum]UCZ59647.1 glycoside hydrolase family 5 protein [Mycolicibacterium phocaicum]
MYWSVRGLVRAGALRGIIAILPIALICAYAPPSSGPSNLTAQIENTAEIVSSPSTIGIADSGLYGQTQAQIDQTLDTLQSIGVQDIRVFVPWIFVEPAQGTYNWSYMDMVMQAAAARNMGVMAEIASTPTWAGSSTSITGAGTPDPATYAAFAAAVAKRYGSTISAYEIWNEPNYVLSSDPIDATAYAALLKAAYPAIKAVDPTATVVAGALGSVISFGSITLDPVTFVKQMLAAGASGYFDALSFHPYQESLPFSSGAGVANSPLNQLNSIYQLLQQYGDGNLKIWISEFGASTNDVSEQTQADLIKNLIDTWQTLAYAGPVFIYTAQDGVAGADGFGIYNADWTPKLAVAVIAAAIKEYASSAAGGVGSTVGGIVSGVTAIAQSLASLLNSISLAIQGEFQQLGKAINAWATAVSSRLSGVLPTATPLAAKATATATAATASVATTAAATAESGTTESTATTSTATKVKKRAKGTGADAASTASTTSDSAAASDGAAEGKASGTAEAGKPADTAAAAEPSGQTSSKPRKDDGSTSHPKGTGGKAARSDKPGDDAADPTTAVTEKRSHRHRDSGAKSSASAN